MTDWHELLEQAAARHGVPGAVLAVATPGTTVVEAVGVANAATGVPVTTDTLFQIGSISKVWTATLAMQLVDEGVLDLDVPVVEYLPSFRIADADASSRMTMRHLLSHTSGLHCDLIFDTGRGDDVLERYLPMIADSALLHPVGAVWSYCNAGFIVAGRALEVLTGHGWDQLVRDRLVAPLGLRRTVTLPEEVLLHRAAVGHVHTKGERFRRADSWHFPRVVGPAGVISSTAEDLVEFARMHLRGGRAADGTEVLSARSAAEMASSQVEIPVPAAAGLVSWGIGWARYRWGGSTVISHGGGTIGQYAFLDVVPDRDAVTVLLTNGGAANDLADEVLGRVAAEVLDLPFPRPVAVVEQSDVPLPVGRFARYGSTVEVRLEDDGPVAIMVDGEEETGSGEHVRRAPLTPGDGAYLARMPGTERPVPLVPVRLPDGVDGIMLGTRLLLAVDR